MGCSGSKDGNITVSTRDFLAMIRTYPSFTKFCFAGDNLKVLTALTKHPVYGGSSLNGIGLKRDKLNSLEEGIKALDKNLDVMQGGGYYILQNIRAKPDTQECMDIYLLTG